MKTKVGKYNTSIIKEEQQFGKEKTLELSKRFSFYLCKIILSLLNYSAAASPSSAAPATELC